MNAAEQLELLTRGTAKVISVDNLKAKLEEGRPLRVKLGVDPTAPDIHLGHTVAFEKLRQFQELGHQVVLIIGDFTATIGDPSGRSATRPPLTREQVLENAKTYTDQAFKILDKESTEVVFNGDWFGKMSYHEVLELNSKVTMQQMLQREDFRTRVEKGQEVRLHEMQYPIMQGWDSVVVRADVEIGGTDQLFNILVGRDLQKEQGMSQQVVMLVPILEGLDGVKKMSKSLNNYVAVNDAPDDMFGKLMSVSDELMSRYYTLLLGEDVPEIHPMDAKKQLAKRIVSRYHSDADGDAALAAFEARFSKKDVDASDWPEFTPPADRKDLIAVVAAAYQNAYDAKRSNSDVRRLIQQGSIQINGEKVTDPKAEPELKAGDVIKLDKKRSVRVG
ncbi:tyrosine--tRNA ligase [Sulfuriroseicoccus oceanibius]|uniref:Tyrosine--tRNA ligase n=1 Tax=Sulfuriroseicoccus oceanibius TaxID=2707525 RepID=A0A6B3LAS3_9BACT|nr:tyrosine--tRNA ligase [Sulfuriroseicoccus oceanibius]QQL45593.1 tyrosine--tRNA ligase [Sulfuriroseicoccus oceanibius]